MRKVKKKGNALEMQKRTAGFSKIKNGVVIGKKILFLQIIFKTLLNGGEGLTFYFLKIHTRIDL